MTRHAPRKFSDGSAELVYAIDAAGKIRHISEVERGYACDCTCPACGAMLNARKGPDNVHHFGHRSFFSCANGPETALHKLAKEIISTERRLLVPEVKAIFGEQSSLIHQRKLVCFDEVVEEARHLSQLVPDIHAKLDEHHLFVEIYVTHACDELKRENLRANGVAAVEIDLSRLRRDSERSVVRDAVIEKADRQWLFHPRIDAAVDAMRIAHRAKVNAQRKQFDDEVSVRLRRYDAGLTELAIRKVASPDNTKEFFRIGLGNHIGCSLGGSGGFTVTEREWQYRVLRVFIPKDDVRRSFRHQAIFEWIKDKKLLRAGFHYVRPELEEAMRERNSQFLSPYRAIEAYLDELVGRGVLQKIKSYSLSEAVFTKLMDLRESIDRKHQRRTSLVERIEKLLERLPESELDDFSLNDWMWQVQEDGMSFGEAIEADDESFDAMLVPLRKIEAMMFRKGAAVAYSLGLPIGAEQARQMEARKREADDREAAKQAEAVRREEALQKAAADRGDALGLTAAKHGDEWVSWITIGQPELDGMTPLAVAILGQEGADRARRLLQSLIERRDEECARNAEIERWKSELEREVFGLLKDRTQPFLDSPYALGPSGKKVKPRDYCVSKETFEECLKLATSIAKKKR
ncbi:hypothetical protein [Tardiphaga robiniae]|uniref:hypothetical protein n=1 Tax=Tardiphaga robiniae TaxID=943830 RepID=UPI0015865769|nr:hypothetical protein [Tardiphaga robiniae]NUU44520.1 hypothetical protein [Tardiphaga robiniae]